jgi:hypothetical protein
MATKQNKPDNLTPNEKSQLSQIYAFIGELSLNGVHFKKSDIHIDWDQKIFTFINQNKTTNAHYYFNIGEEELYVSIDHNLSEHSINGKVIYSDLNFDVEKSFIDIPRIAKILTKIHDDFDIELQKYKQVQPFTNTDFDVKHSTIIQQFNTKYNVVDAKKKEHLFCSLASLEALQVEAREHRKKHYRFNISTRIKIQTVVSTYIRGYINGVEVYLPLHVGRDVPNDFEAIESSIERDGAFLHETAKTIFAKHNLVHYHFYS